MLRFVLTGIFLTLAGPALAAQETVTNDVLWTDGAVYDFVSRVALEDPAAPGRVSARAWLHSLPRLAREPEAKITRAKLIITARFDRASASCGGRLGTLPIHWTSPAAGVVCAVLDLPSPKDHPKLWSKDGITIMLEALEKSGVTLIESTLLVQYDEKPNPVPDPATTRQRG